MRTKNEKICREIKEGKNYVPKSQDIILLARNLKTLEDPKAQHLIEQDLLHIIGLIVCAVICRRDFISLRH